MRNMTQAEMDAAWEVIEAARVAEDTCDEAFHGADPLAMEDLGIALDEFDAFAPEAASGCYDEGADHAMEQEYRGPVVIESEDHKMTWTEKLIYAGIVIGAVAVAWLA